MQWYVKTAPVCANCRCSRLWFSLIPVNGIDITAFEFVETVRQRSRWPKNYLRCPLSDEIVSLNDPSTSCPHYHSPLLSVFQYFRVITFRNRSAKIIICWRLVSCNSGPKSESAKFYGLQLRLRLNAKQFSPTDSNSSFESNSASLPESVMLIS